MNSPAETTHHGYESHHETVNQIAIVKEGNYLEYLEHTGPGKAAIMQSGQQIDGQGNDVEDECPGGHIGATQSINGQSNVQDSQHCSVSMENQLQMLGESDLFLQGCQYIIYILYNLTPSLLTLRCNFR